MRHNRAGALRTSNMRDSVRLTSVLGVNVHSADTSTSERNTSTWLSMPAASSDFSSVSCGSDAAPGVGAPKRSANFSRSLNSPSWPCGGVVWRGRGAGVEETPTVACGVRVHVSGDEAQAAQALRWLARAHTRQRTLANTTSVPFGLSSPAAVCTTDRVSAQSWLRHSAT